MILKETYFHAAALARYGFIVATQKTSKLDNIKTNISKK